MRNKSNEISKRINRPNNTPIDIKIAQMIDFDKYTLYTTLKLREIQMSPVEIENDSNDSIFISINTLNNTLKFVSELEKMILVK